MTAPNSDGVLFRPFAGLRVDQKWAARLSAPPYDVLNEEEARALVAANPDSFLRVSRPEVNFPPGTDSHGAEVYAEAAVVMASLVTSGQLVRDPGRRYYIYRMIDQGHRQTGIVGLASLAAYGDGRVLRHENTTPDKEDDRVRHMQALDAQVGPVMLAHRRSGPIADIIEAVTASPPLIEVTAADGVEHLLWDAGEAALMEATEAAFEDLGQLYIADGHHRAAAAARVAAARPPVPDDGFLAVAFAEDQVRILDYNRVIRDLNGLTVDAFLDKVRDQFRVTPAGPDQKTDCPGVLGMYLDGQWHRLQIKDPPLTTPALERLDINLLTDRLLSPVLGIGDPRTDPRIDFVGGARGLGELEHRVTTDGWAVAFSLFPTALGDMMAVADDGDKMPPKSTWFEPKLADGLIFHPLD